MVCGHVQLTATLKVRQHPVTQGTVLSAGGDNEGSLSGRLKVSEQRFECEDDAYVNEK